MVWLLLLILLYQIIVRKPFIKRAAREFGYGGIYIQQTALYLVDHNQVTVTVKKISIVFFQLLQILLRCSIGCIFYHWYTFLQIASQI
jgi:hypothetical protein